MPLRAVAYNLPHGYFTGSASKIVYLKSWNKA